MSANFGLCHSLQISISQIWIVSPNLEASVLTALTARERREKREEREERDRETEEKERRDRRERQPRDGYSDRSRVMFWGECVFGLIL